MRGKEVSTNSPTANLTNAGPFSLNQPFIRLDFALVVKQLSAKRGARAKPQLGLLLAAHSSTTEQGP
jgi:hypothetical protein